MATKVLNLECNNFPGRIRTIQQYLPMISPLSELYISDVFIRNTDPHVLLCCQYYYTSKMACMCACVKMMPGSQSE